MSTGRSLKPVPKAMAEKTYAQMRIRRPRKRPAASGEHQAHPGAGGARFRQFDCGGRLHALFRRWPQSAGIDHNAATIGRLDDGTDPRRVLTMKLRIAAAAALVGAGLIASGMAAPAQAEGWHHGHGRGGYGRGGPPPRHHGGGGAAVAGIVGGLALGALALGAVNAVRPPRRRRSTTRRRRPWSMPRRRPITRHPRAIMPRRRWRTGRLMAGNPGAAPPAPDCRRPGPRAARPASPRRRRRPRCRRRW